tara:strand:- start:2709 stop:3101 length:393 start_codon:yes stop_codon:yes gene_type:complete
MPKKSVSKLKKEIDKYFSLYIRLRYASKDGMVKCFTCNKTSHYKKGMQAGHFQSRRFLPTRWNEDNVQVQCVKCNMFSQGEQYKFSLNLGEDKSKELEALARSTVKYMRHEYEELLERYKQEVKKLTNDS